MNLEVMIYMLSVAVVVLGFTLLYLLAEMSKTDKKFGSLFDNFNPDYHANLSEKIKQIQRDIERSSKYHYNLRGDGIKNYEMFNKILYHLKLEITKTPSSVGLTKIKKKK